MIRRPRRRLAGGLAAVLAVAVLLVVWLPGVARAHMGSTKYLRVERTAGGALVVADVDAVDAAWQLQLDDGDEAALARRALDVGRWLARALRVTSRAGRCRAEPSAARAVERNGRRFVSVTLDYACPEPVEDVRLLDTAVFDSDPQHESVVKLTAGGRQSATILRVGRQELRLGEHPTLLATMGRFVLEGIIHLVTGYDHVLFLLSLILVAGEVAARSGLRRGLRDVAVIVTGFTIGHSVTLMAAALDLVVLPTRLVESVIALSIVVVAVWNVWRPEMRRGLPWVAALFGLVHGFGFSSVLKELVLPTGGQVVALLSFNLGIELAQLAVVAVVLGPLAWAARRPWYRRAIVQSGSVAIAIVAAWWFVERAFGLSV